MTYYEWFYWVGVFIALTSTMYSLTFEKDNRLDDGTRCNIYNFACIVAGSILSLLSWLHIMINIWEYIKKNNKNDIR